MFYNVLWRKLLTIGPGTPGQTPSLFDKCTGFFYMRYITQSTFAKQYFLLNRFMKLAPGAGFALSD